MQRNLTQGNITGTMLRFALPMILGNLLQQFYNIADTLIVGRYLGANALAAVGAAYALMTFLTSILLGLCMGSGAVFSLRYGEKNEKLLKKSIFVSFVMIAAVALAVNVAVFLFIDPIMGLLCVPAEIYSMMREYLWMIFWGILAVFLYNFFASLLRSVGNSFVPLLFLGIAAVLNVVLDLVFVLVFNGGVAGAAGATVIAQYVSGIGIAIYTYVKMPEFRVAGSDMGMDRGVLREISQFSVLTCAQQSVMNFGILMVQGLVNSFGTVVMAAFAAAVKIDSFAYMPVQDFGNAFSFFVAQNYGAKKYARIRKGFLLALVSVLIFCLVISAAVFGFADTLMGFFTNEGSAISAAGAEYLRVEGAFYVGIGILFLLYGYYRAVDKPVVSVVLTIISLGTRVLLAYALTGLFHTGVIGIWAAIPIGWGLADLVGMVGIVSSFRGHFFRFP